MVRHRDAASGITPGGSCRAPAAAECQLLEAGARGATDVGVYVPGGRTTGTGRQPEDPVNPQMQLGRRFKYAVRLMRRPTVAPASLIRLGCGAPKGLRRTLNFIPPRS